MVDPLSTKAAAALDVEQLEDAPELEKFPVAEAFFPGHGTTQMWSSLKRRNV